MSALVFMREVHSEFLALFGNKSELVWEARKKVIFFVNPALCSEFLRYGEQSFFSKLTLNGGLE